MERLPNQVHQIKIYRQHWLNVNQGTKTFEIRKNDRPYQKGDRLILIPWCPEKNQRLENVYLDLKFTIGDVYPIDADRVVFSLLERED